MSKVDQLRQLRETKWQRRRQLTSSIQPATPVPASETPLQRGPRMPEATVASGKPIHRYTDEELALVVRQIMADVGSSEFDSVLPEVMQRLGFVRQGKIIKQRVRSALAAAAMDSTVQSMDLMHS